MQLPSRWILKDAKFRKRVLVVVADGGDNASRLKFREWIGRVEEEYALIYAVGMFESMGGLLPLMDSSKGAQMNITREEMKATRSGTGSNAVWPLKEDPLRTMELSNVYFSGKGT